MQSKTQITVILALALTGCATVNVSEYEQGCRDGATTAIKLTNNEPISDGVNSLCKNLNDENHPKAQREIGGRGGR